MTNADFKDLYFSVDENFHENFCFCLCVRECVLISPNHIGTFFLLYVAKIRATKP